MPIRILVFTALLGLVSACSDTSSSPLTPTDGPASSTSIEKGGNLVSGTVYAGTEAGDQRLANAIIVVVSGNGQTRSTQTSSQGAYSVNVPAGDATITASKDGYTPKSWSITVAKDVILNFSLSFE